ncbi:hypothetical protein ABFE25_31290 [Bacillus toyonensis]|uniref:hypothetical protein n=2 Tax=Bacillus TaxID=1386 RepID=UPI0026BD68C3
MMKNSYNDESQNIVDESKHIYYSKEKGPGQNWLVIFGGLFSFFILLFILSQIID